MKKKNKNKKLRINSINKFFKAISKGYKCWYFQQQSYHPLQLFDQEQSEKSANSSHFPRCIYILFFAQRVSRGVSTTPAIKTNKQTMVSHLYYLWTRYESYSNSTSARGSSRTNRLWPWPESVRGKGPSRLARTDSSQRFLHSQIVSSGC